MHATLITTLPFNGVAEQRLYRLVPPHRGHEYVVVSAAVVVPSGPETAIVASDKTGALGDWDELPGTFRGALDHQGALRRAGYVVSTARDQGAAS